MAETSELKAGRELDFTIAHEFTLLPVGGACKVCGNMPDEAGELRHGRGCYTQSENGGGSEFFDACPHYSTDIAAAFEMEAAIAAMGLSSRYGEILRDSLAYDVTHMGSDGREIMPAHPFDIAHASPLQRCIAAVKAIRQHNP